MTTNEWEKLIEVAREGYELADRKRGHDDRRELDESDRCLVAQRDKLVRLALLVVALLGGCTVQRLVVLEVPPLPDGGRCVQVTQEFQLGTLDLHDLLTLRADAGR